MKGIAVCITNPPWTGWNTSTSMPRILFTGTHLRIGGAKSDLKLVSIEEISGFEPNLCHTLLQTDKRDRKLNLIRLLKKSHSFYGLNSYWLKKN